MKKQHNFHELLTKLKQKSREIASAVAIIGIEDIVTICDQKIFDINRL